MLNNFPKATQLESNSRIQAEDSGRKTSSTKISATGFAFQIKERRPMQWECSMGRILGKLSMLFHLYSFYFFSIPTFAESKLISYRF